MGFAQRPGKEDTEAQGHRSDMPLTPLETTPQKLVTLQLIFGMIVHELYPDHGGNQGRCRQITGSSGTTPEAPRVQQTFRLCLMTKKSTLPGQGSRVHLRQ